MMHRTTEPVDNVLQLSDIPPAQMWVPATHPRHNLSSSNSLCTTPEIKPAFNLKTPHFNNADTQTPHFWWVHIPNSRGHTQFVDRYRPPAESGLGKTTQWLHIPRRIRGRVR